MSFIIQFNNIRNQDISIVGGKNASLGEMIQTLSPLGISVPQGFAITADGYRYFLQSNHLFKPLQDILSSLNTGDLSNLHEVGSTCRKLMSDATLPDDLANQILFSYHEMEEKGIQSVAVRSSATAEDLPNASFAGQHDSFLNVHGDEPLLRAIKSCYVSLFNDRAIKYRVDNGFEHMDVALSVGVQAMVRSDKGSAGVAFTIEPENGAEQIIYITSAWGLGENIVQGAVSPDEFYLFKPSVRQKKRSLFKSKLGAKETKMVFSDEREILQSGSIHRMDTTPEEKSRFSLTDIEVEKLGTWCQMIEDHYGQAMDVEWAKDGITGEIYIVQARPETIHSAISDFTIKEFSFKPLTNPICTGKAVGRDIAVGRVCIVKDLSDAGKVNKGDIIVADITNPDWNALLKKAICIVTNKGGRTSHASIVARELGIHAVVGTGNATTVLSDGQEITVSCIEGDTGKIYNGTQEWKTIETPVKNIPKTRTKPMFILADPDKALYLSRFPNEGVGLLRMEFIITNSIRIHPMALVKYDEMPDSKEKEAIKAITSNFTDKKRFFTKQLSESIAMVAAAFFPREVIVRMSDFKTNEYAQLIGGSQFEPVEENPMLGFRGASRYYHEKYMEGFGLECEALRILRDEMGFTNIKIMIPFCRTLEEGKKVLAVMQSFGLERGKNGLEVYVMAEIPSNVILAQQFAEIFDGFSIGSNDLTQLTLGIDRDSVIISDLFDENNPAVKEMLQKVIKDAHTYDKPIGLCGQAPSDYPEFARFLVDAGINSISFVPDALLRGIENIFVAESTSTAHKQHN